MSKSTERTCDRCKHTGPMWEFGLIQLPGEEEKYYCHLTMSEGPTCYMQQNWENSDAAWRKYMNSGRTVPHKYTPLADPFKGMEEL